MLAETTLHQTKSMLGIQSFDDQERYLKMAIKINPNDPTVLERNSNNNDMISSISSLCTLFRNGLHLAFVLKSWTLLATKAKQCSVPGR